jgi:hypothetical protein
VKASFDKGKKLPVTRVKSTFKEYSN